MAIRIVGVDVPQNKRGEIALTFVYGIGRNNSAKILDESWCGQRSEGERLDRMIRLQRFVRSSVQSIRLKVIFVLKYN